MRHEIIIRKSRFIGDVFHVTSEEEALSRLQDVRTEFPDASHHCYAYAVRQESLVQRFSDDGEPSGTAGMPILQVINSRELQNVLVVVTRYFGGIKLGAGGLVRAYTRTAAEVLDEAGTVCMVLSSRGIISIDYAQVGPVEYFLRQNGVHIVDTEYRDKVNMTVVTSMKWDDFCGMLNEVCNGRLECTRLSPVFHAWE
ncbi:MAG: YigZ family protein [Clostridiales bacterium]|jgi:uncharacterized YigZ family protein|nr:YigZ family protein [Clostridiales bacterium]